MRPNVSDSTDDAFMGQALALARAAIGLTEPNPRVGCVLVAADGVTLLGQGHTQARGGPHAEIMALGDAAARGHALAGATAYVTLEPCSHHGRTGPGAQEAHELNIGFFSRMQRGLPWVRLKIAASLDGTTALENGASQWITSPAARADGHAWRARAGMILTGIGTVLEDNPRLDVRLVATPRQPPLAVVDSRLQTPPHAHVFIEGRPLLVYAAVPDAARRQALEARGATVLYLPSPGGKVDLAAMLRDLAAREVNELHVEAGHKLNASLLREGLVDELLVYLAPALLGVGRPMAALGPLQALEDRISLDFGAVASIGPDLRLLARVTRRNTPGESATRP